MWRSYFHELVIGTSTGSQIEGTQSSFSVFVLLKSAEAPGVPLEGVEKVSNYIAAKRYKYILRAHVLPTLGAAALHETTPGQYPIECK